MAPALPSQRSWSSKSQCQEARGRVSELCPSGRDTSHTNIHISLWVPWCQARTELMETPSGHAYTYTECIHTYLTTTRRERKNEPLGTTVFWDPKPQQVPISEAAASLNAAGMHSYLRQECRAGLPPWLCRLQGGCSGNPLHTSLCGPSRGWEELALKSVVVSGLKEHGPSGGCERSHLWAMRLTLLSPLVTCNKPQLAAQQGGQGCPRQWPMCPQADTTVV